LPFREPVNAARVTFQVNLTLLTSANAGDMKRAFSGRQALWGALSLASPKALDREKPKCQQEDICLARAHAARQRSIFLGQRRANPAKDQENESGGVNNKDRRE
jgi:hypothetical protein